MEIKDVKDKTTVLTFANVAGKHKCKLDVIGKSLCPCCFKGINVLPVHYYAIKKAWFIRDMFLASFRNTLYHSSSSLQES